MRWFIEGRCHNFERSEDGVLKLVGIGWLAAKSELERSMDLGPWTKDRGPRTKDLGPRTEDQGPRPRTKDQGPRTEDRGPKTEGQRPRTKDRGQRTNDQGYQGPRIKDEGPRIKDHGPCFGTNEHPTRDTDVTFRQSKAPLDFFNSRSVFWSNSWST